MSTMRHVNSRLAARTGIRQIEASLRADATALAADRAVLHVWRNVIELLRTRRPWNEAGWVARILFGGLLPRVRTTIAQRLQRTARWGHKSAVANIRAALPAKTLAAAAVRKLQEGRDGSSGMAGASSGDDGDWPSDSLVEGDDAPLILTDFLAWLRTLGFDAAGGSPPASAQGLPSNKEPAISPAAAYLSALLFPAPSPQDIARVVYDSDWQDRLAAGTRLAQPSALASVVASGLAAGKSQQEIARDLAPVVQNVRSTARRIARTESLRVAGDMQMQAHQQLGPLVIGYVVHATLDQHSRPWHAHRSGTVYYLDPRPGQKGPPQMPHPPDEPADPAERPAGTPQTAWNCR